MSDTNGTNGGKRLAVYAIHEVPDEAETGKRHTRWVKIGVAHHNRDGSLNLYLDAFPIGTNKLQVREDDRTSLAPPRRGPLETLEVRP